MQDESYKTLADSDRPLVIRCLEGLIRFVLGGMVRISLRVFNRTNHDIIRHAMYQELKEFFACNVVAAPGAKVLSISGSYELANLACPDPVVLDAAYPEFNIMSLPFPDETFDLVVSDQVFEHIEGDPFLAMNETFRVLKPGGCVVHTTCLLVQIHGYPSDFWRFTPDGLSLLCQGHGQVLFCKGWGNRYLWFLSWLGVIFGEKVPAMKQHPYAWIARFNEWRYPVVTWIVARKN
jgi:SAM-dependent methyltransferase